MKVLCKYHITVKIKMIFKNHYFSLDIHFWIHFPITPTKESQSINLKNIKTGHLQFSHNHITICKVLASII
jgi:hypothetical protein